MAPRSNKPGWIDWVNSGAREIILEDLEPNGWLYEIGFDNLLVDNTFLQDCLNFYKSEHYGDQSEFFEHVVFDQFQARMKDHIREAKKRNSRSTEEEEWLRHDRQHYPRATHNARGEPVFDMDPAKMLLRDDVKNKLHEQMTPKELWSLPTRAAYRKFTLSIFRQRIYQEIRLQKYTNYLEEKRTKKRDKERARRAV
jgi:hypothetical protein